MAEKQIEVCEIKNGRRLKEHTSVWKSLFRLPVKVSQTAQELVGFLVFFLAEPC